MASTRLGVSTRLALTFLLVPAWIGTAWAQTPGTHRTGSAGVRESTASIMARQAASPPRGAPP
jgi:hypothetical protein